MHAMLSAEFLDKFKSGQREFDGILLQYCDIGGSDLRGLKLRNSKLLFVYMRNCNFEGAVFENCEMSFVGFRGSDFGNVVLRNCRIEYFGMSVVTHNTKMVSCSLYCGEMLEADWGEINAVNCSESRVFRTVDEDALRVLGSIFSEIGPLVQQLDFDMQGKMRSLIEEFGKRIRHSVPPEYESAAYKSKNERYDANTGYGVFDSIFHEMIDAYEKTPVYKARKDAYERRNNYG